MAKRAAIRQDPAYRLYTADFLVRNFDITDEQMGKFIRLLCYQHQNGHLSEETMKSFCKGVDEMVFSRFSRDGQGRYYNLEMEKEVQRRVEVSKTKSENAKKRKGKENDIVDTHISEYDDDV